MAKCKECGKPTPKYKRYCTKHKAKTIFQEPAKYGTYEGRLGDPDDWRAAFKERFSKEQIAAYLGDRTAWDILEIPVGASEAEVKKAYRRKAKETHPDHHPGIDPSLFRDVNAAFQALMGEDPNGYYG